MEMIYGLPVLKTSATTVQYKARYLAVHSIRAQLTRAIQEGIFRIRTHTAPQKTRAAPHHTLLLLSATQPWLFLPF